MGRPPKKKGAAHKADVPWKLLKKLEELKLNRDLDLRAAHIEPVDPFYKNNITTLMKKHVRLIREMEARVKQS
jgi:hypothetical protein